VRLITWLNSVITTALHFNQNDNREIITSYSLTRLFDATLFDVFCFFAALDCSSLSTEFLRSFRKQKIKKEKKKLK
jgi:hypothetical protein